MPPRTVVVNPTTPGPSLTFELPTTFGFDVQSVLANIDATAAGDTVAEIVVADVSGAVIATKRQSSPIPAGDAGSATWALRLDDDGGAAVAAPVVWEWLLSIGTGAGNNWATAYQSGTLDAINAAHIFVSDSCEVSWTAAINDPLVLTGFNWSSIPLIFDLTMLNVQRTDAAGATTYSGNGTIIAPGAFARIPVNARTFGPANVNIANPLAPFFAVAGRYSVGASITVRP